MLSLLDTDLDILFREVTFPDAIELVSVSTRQAGATRIDVTLAFELMEWAALDDLVEFSVRVARDPAQVVPAKVAEASLWHAARDQVLIGSACADVLGDVYPLMNTDRSVGVFDTFAAIGASVGLVPWTDCMGEAGRLPSVLASVQVITGVSSPVLPNGVDVSFVVLYTGLFDGLHVYDVLVHSEKRESRVQWSAARVRFEVDGEATLRKTPGAFIGNAPAGSGTGVRRDAFSALLNSDSAQAVVFGPGLMSESDSPRVCSLALPATSKTPPSVLAAPESASLFGWVQGEYTVTVSNAAHIEAVAGVLKQYEAEVEKDDDSDGGGRTTGTSSIGTVLIVVAGIFMAMSAGLAYRRKRGVPQPPPTRYYRSGTLNSQPMAMTNAAPASPLAPGHQQQHYQVGDEDRFEQRNPIFSADDGTADVNAAGTEMFDGSLVGMESMMMWNSAGHQAAGVDSVEVQNPAGPDADTATNARDYRSGTLSGLENVNMRHV